MTQQRTIKARVIVSDIRSGMTVTQLMEKYQVSLVKLHYIFRILSHAHAIDRKELEPLVSIPDERLDIGKTRRTHRHCVFVRLPIYDLDNLLQEGTVVDISEEGLQVSGFPFRAGDVRELLLQADHFADVYPFVMEAQYQWAFESPGGQITAGFKITSISEASREELRKVSRMLALSA
jgi:hypothetical protein